MGGDVDPAAVMGHGFESFLLDQLDVATFPSRSTIGEVDLLIDDGLHMPTSNINTLAWGLSVISKRGVIVIEDIPDAVLPIWEVVQRVLPSSFGAFVFTGSNVNAFVVSKVATMASAFPEVSVPLSGQRKAL